MHDGIGWIGRDYQGVEISFRIDSSIKQKFIDDFQRDIDENFINVKTYKYILKKTNDSIDKNLNLI